ncbi:nuclear transport factor 2 family protein [Pseudoflavitalea sp. G-6-1-2]|uniref:YybH family protein n=1 Tax=Pseudoflavitalea sp. G-6-1-2 TaxID=2728841 RepID=UPI00146D52C4|nr:nuclear transport factor 2 family protein [Pseudoflavitalea sp. G-6-1-2]NML19908.1 nuclear transport factor 2 family protein [Pseudoflavitalea sp. G-6-1-2]
MRSLLLILLIACLSPVVAKAQSADEKAIREILAKQNAAWNRGDLEGFMKGYWNNDSLMFVGKSGVTYGYKNTLENYKKGYGNGNVDSMGKLTFTFIRFTRVSPEYYFVVGKWELKEKKDGDMSGHFNLLIRKINKEWVIVADHSS